MSRYAMPLPEELLSQSGFSKCLGRFVCGHYRQRFVELPFGDLIKVIAMEMGENHQVKRRQLMNLDRRVRQSCGVHPVTNRNLFMHVDESRVRQYRISCIT